MCSLIINDCSFDVFVGLFGRRFIRRFEFGVGRGVYIRVRGYVRAFREAYGMRSCV